MTDQLTAVLDAHRGLDHWSIDLSDIQLKPGDSRC
jgi:hypothetical protein